VNALMMPPKPSALSFEEASTTPIVIVTVQMAFIQAMRLSASDSLLIHAATGGVGLASIQLGHLVGYQCMGTAGSAKKRTVARALGARDAVGSRSTAYPDNLATCSDGMLCGGVVNSLTSAGFLAATLGSLCTKAGFVELGKREVWAQGAVALDRGDVSYHFLATDFLPVGANSLFNLQPLSQLLANGMIVPLPMLVHSMANTPHALRMLSQALHVGKIVVNAYAPQAHRGSSSLFEISGGLGSLGLLMADWMLSHEPSPLRLLGRSGRLSMQDETSARIWQSGACTTAVRCDLSSMDEATSSVSAPHLFGGLIHAGGVLRDAVISNMTAESCRAVFAPKVHGLCNLDTRMRLAPLKVVVMFSSIASLLGGVGQTNYTAANAALDAAMMTRQTQGSMGGSVQWGAWAEVGMALRNKSTIERADRAGTGSLTPGVGLEVLAVFLGALSRGGERVNLLDTSVASPFVWSTFLKRQLNPGIFNGYAVVLDPVVAPAGRSKKAKKRHTNRAPPLTQAPALVSEDRQQVLVTQVLDTLSSVVGSSINMDDPLLDAGVDSLGAVELRNALSLSFGIDLPSTLSRYYGLLLFQLLAC